MAREQAFVAEYRVETPEVVPLVPALEALAMPEVRVTRWWKLLVPGETEPVDTTCRAKLAEGWRRLGGVTAWYERERKEPASVQPVPLAAWREELQAWAKAEGLTWGGEEGHMDAYGNFAAIKTPSRLGQGEHLRRRRAVEAVLRGHDLAFELECITQHSDQVCRPLFPETQEQLPVTVSVTGGGA